MMKTNDTIIRDRESAVGYDEQARKTNWLGPEVIFGLAYEFLKPGDSLVDLGIGSGLSSILFHKAGLLVYGLDGSSEILQVCASKNLAVELKQHDLRSLPLPYSPRCFDHVLCVAVLNSFQELAPLFHDIGRIIKPEGIFAFTVEDQKTGEDESYAINRVDVSSSPEPEAAVTLFRHPVGYITQLLDDNGFELRKSLEFVAFRYPADNRDIFFNAYIAQGRRSSM